MKHVVLLCLLTFYAPGSNAAELLLVFHPQYKGHAVTITDSSFRFREDSLEVETFRWYISHVSLSHKGVAVWSEPSSIHLLDAANDYSLKIALRIPDSLLYDALHLELGVDSQTNVSGALEGDLDPVKGMYWAWQSGYINLKLEGKSPHSGSKNRQFQLHLGGYLPPNQTLQRMDLPVRAGAAIHILIAVEHFLNAIDLNSRHHVMSPGPAAKDLSEKAARMFRVLE